MRSSCLRINGVQVESSSEVMASVVGLLSADDNTQALDGKTAFSPQLQSGGLSEDFCLNQIISVLSILGLAGSSNWRRSEELL